MPLERKKTLNVFKEAGQAWGSYDDYPVGPKGIDPMPHLSRNRVPQPFFLVSETDQVLIQMSGEAELELKETTPTRMHIQPGDTIYIPAGVPNRLFPKAENLTIRLKAYPPSREAVAWYCPSCGELVHARAIESEVPQEGYWEAVHLFNGDPVLRTCAGCSAIHPPVDLGDIAWADVAAALRSEG